MTETPLSPSDSSPSTETPSAPSDSSPLTETPSTPPDSSPSTETPLAPSDSSPSTETPSAPSDYSPSTILVCLGEGIFFDHEGSADVLSVKVRDADELGPLLSEAVRRLEGDGDGGGDGDSRGPTVENLHVILRSSSISTIYDSRAVTSFVPSLIPGKGTATIHVMSASVDSPVQPADVDEIRASLVMTGLSLEQESVSEDGSGGWVLVARKPGDASEEEEEEDDEVEEEDGIKEAGGVEDADKEEERQRTLFIDEALKSCED